MNIKLLQSFALGQEMRHRLLVDTRTFTRDALQDEAYELGVRRLQILRATMLAPSDAINTIIPKADG